jgi:hypothetical protein
MYSPKPPDPAVQELGGDLLEGSGFETEDPVTVEELDERSAEEDVLR